MSMADGDPLQLYIQPQEREKKKQEAQEEKKKLFEEGGGSAGRCRQRARTLQAAVAPTSAQANMLKRDLIV